VDAPPESAAVHEPGGDAGAEIEVRHRRQRVRTAQHRGTDGSGLDVVLGPHRNAQARPECEGQIELVDAEVDRMGDHRASRSDLPRHPDAERGEGGRGHGDGGSQLVHRVEDRRDRHPRPTRSPGAHERGSADPRVAAARVG
jgi:hypothetical protein